MRKFLLALTCMLLVAGLVIAAEHTIVSYDKDKKVLTLKDKDGKEVHGKITDATKFYSLKGEEKTEGKVENFEKMATSEKAAGRKIDVTIKDGVVTEVIQTRGKGKNKN